VTAQSATSAEARLAQARQWAASGRIQEAIQALQAAPTSEAPSTWALLVQLLKAQDRLDEALTIRLKQVAAKPSSAVAHHNVAAILGDLGRADEAEVAVRRAFRHGGDAPETWLVLARALIGQNRYDEADDAFRQALARRPGDVAAVKELAQLIWMRTADRAEALAPIEAAIATFPEQAPLYMLRAQLKTFTGAAPEDIWRDLSTSPVARIGGVELASAVAALAFDRDLALAHGRAAVAGLRGEAAAARQLAEIHLSRDEAGEALAVLTPILETNPGDQEALALRGLAWRMLNDPRAADGDHYRAMVGRSVIDTPPGWKTLDAYLAELAMALRGLHGLRTHPVGQSLRHGTQTTVNLRTSPDPVIRAFFTAIDRPIREHMRKIAATGDPRGEAQDYRLVGCWSVELAPGGYHTAHIHPQGWLSSACHIELPSVVDGGGKEGWLGFGGAPFDGLRPLPHEHYEKPSPGQLVLFPSSMWHGTVPFSGAETRLTIAFDVVPA
jgi:tetratricopeptide (TPR) repeat protein